MDLDNELGGPVAAQALTLAKQVAGRCFSAGPFVVSDATSGTETEFGMFMRLLAEELLSPCELVRKLVGRE